MLTLKHLIPLFFFVIHTAIVKDEEEENYVALIAKKDNPQLKEVMSVFTNEIEMFTENK